MSNGSSDLVLSGWKGKRGDLREVHGVASAFFAWQLRSPAWCLVRLDCQGKVQGGRIVSLEQVLLLLLSCLTLEKYAGLILTLVSLQSPHSPLVTVSVFQADDGADKNVSSVQIVGKCESEALKGYCCCLLCTVPSSAMVFVFLAFCP